MNRTYRSFYQRFWEDISDTSMQLERVSGCDSLEGLADLYDDIAVFAQYDPRKKNGIRLPTLPNGSRERLIQLIDLIRDKAGDLYEQERKIVVQDIMMIPDRDSYELREDIYVRCEKLERSKEKIDCLPSDFELADCTEFHRQLIGYLDDLNVVKDSFERWMIPIDDVGLKRSELAGTRHDIEVLVYRFSKLQTPMGRRYSDVGHWYIEIKKLDKAIKRIPKNKLYLRQMGWRPTDPVPRIQEIEVPYYRQVQKELLTPQDVKIPRYIVLKEDEPTNTEEDNIQDSRDKVIPLFRESHPQVTPVQVSFMDSGSLYADLTFCSEILDVKPSTNRIKEWQDILTDADCSRTELTSRFNDFYESLSNSSRLRKNEIDFLKKLKRSVEDDTALGTLCSRTGHLPDSVEKSMGRIEKILALAG